MTTARNKWNSAVFYAYNKARKARNEGKFKIDLPTFRKAFGLALSKETRPYNSSFTDCDCPWRLKTGKICKHMGAEMLKYRALHPKDKPCNHINTFYALPSDDFGWVLVCADCHTLLKEGE